MTLNLEEFTEWFEKKDLNQFLRKPLEKDLLEQASFWEKVYQQNIPFGEFFIDLDRLEKIENSLRESTKNFSIKPLLIFFPRTDSKADKKLLKAEFIAKKILSDKTELIKSCEGIFSVNESTYPQGTSREARIYFDTMDFIGGTCELIFINTRPESPKNKKRPEDEGIADLAEIFILGTILKKPLKNGTIKVSSRCYKNRRLVSLLYSDDFRILNFDANHYSIYKKF